VACTSLEPGACLDTGSVIVADLSGAACARASRFLSALDGDWARHIDVIGPCSLETKPAREPYEALVRAVAYQQLHAKAGDAILARFLAQFPENAFPSPAAVLSADDLQLRSCGFSANKLVTLRAIAQATVDGVVPTLAEALALPDQALIERLTGLRGIGRWTVEMFLIYSLERSDILPVDDFGVRDGFRRLKNWETMPTPRQMAELSRPWGPYRTVAAWYLWRSTR